MFKGISSFRASECCWTTRLSLDSYTYPLHYSYHYWPRSDLDILFINSYSTTDTQPFSALAQHQPTALFALVGIKPSQLLCVYCFSFQMTLLFNISISLIREISTLSAILCRMLRVWSQSGNCLEVLKSVSQKIYLDAIIFHSYQLGSFAVWLNVSLHSVVFGLFCVKFTSKS